MTERAKALLGVWLSLVLPASLVSAQEWSSPPPPPPPPSESPSYGQSSSYQPYEGQPPPPPEQKIYRGFQGGFNIGVPVWLDVDRNVVRPGADLHFFGGLDIKYALFALDLGVMWTPIDLNNVPTNAPGTGLGRSPLTRLYFGPEVRVQVPNKSPVLPYLGAVFDVNWWRFRETSLACNWWYCTQVAVFRFAPGFTAKAGIAFHTRHGVHVDLGMKYSLSGKGDFFLRREQWITPYVGILVR